MNISNDSKGLFDYKYLFYLYLVTDDFDEELEVNRENLYNKVLRLIQQRGSMLAEHNQKHLYLGNFLNKYIVENHV